ncbi:MAG TPA: hypothetical protein VKA84_08415 [Gemmatimonadaceae bacterium]|jgi:hypothetical protein|nr:hypothetical protein [Gemmatimonadaceae bacterium]
MIFLLYPVLGAVFWGGMIYLGLRAVRALEARGAARDEIADLRARVARLEEDLGTMNAEVGQIAEGQRFTTALLTERKGEPRPPGT